VYDFTGKVFIYEAEGSGPEDAKLVAVAFAVAYLFDNSDGLQPELLSPMLPWKWAG